MTKCWSTHIFQLASNWLFFNTFSLVGKQCNLLQHLLCVPGSANTGQALLDGTQAPPQHVPSHTICWSECFPEEKLPRSYNVPKVCWFPGRKAPLRITWSVALGVSILTHCWVSPLHQGPGYSPSDILCHSPGDPVPEIVPYQDAFLLSLGH